VKFAYGNEKLIILPVFDFYIFPLYSREILKNYLPEYSDSVVNVDNMVARPDFEKQIKALCNAFSGPFPYEDVRQYIIADMYFASVLKAFQIAHFRRDLNDFYIRHDIVITYEICKSFPVFRVYYLFYFRIL
jgi:hypothetical protein